MNHRSRFICQSSKTQKRIAAIKITHRNKYIHKRVEEREQCGSCSLWTRRRVENDALIKWRKGRRQIVVLCIYDGKDVRGSVGELFGCLRATLAV